MDEKLLKDRVNYLFDKVAQLNTIEAAAVLLMSQKFDEFVKDEPLTWIITQAYVKHSTATEIEMLDYLIDRVGLLDEAEYFAVRAMHHDLEKFASDERFVFKVENAFDRLRAMERPK